MSVFVCIDLYLKLLSVYVFTNPIHIYSHVDVYSIYGQMFRYPFKHAVRAHIHTYICTLIHTCKSAYWQAYMNPRRFGSN